MLTHAGIHLDPVTYAVYVCQLYNRKYRSAASVWRDLDFFFPEIFHISCVYKIYCNTESALF